MILFWNTVSDITGIELQREHIRQAAILTFVNVVILSLIFSIINIVRRRIMVDKPVKRIVDAAERIMQGDLSVRIEKASSADPNDGFNTVIDYFNKMAQELSGMETLRTDFVANVSHELKTPLSVMQNYGTLLLGGGMSCTMVWKEELFIQGIILGAIGIVCIIAAYPIYLHITGKRKKKLAPEIIRLTDELTKGQ